MRRPMKCPICGGEIKRITNATTKNSYFRCSNKDCHFVLGSEYTDAEFYLQGKKLAATCIKCRKSLTIANGPHGLYARCFNCDCDSTPTKYEGKIYSKWANAHIGEAMKEIKSLKTHSFVDENDNLYDFDTYIASAEPKEEVKIPEAEKEVTTICEEILIYLGNKKMTPRSSEDISKSTGLKINSIRTSLLSLKSLGLVKIVGYTKNTAGNHTILYQVAESGLPALKIYTKNDGYDTLNAFLKDNADKYGSVIRAKEVLKKALRENNVDSVLFHSSRGICDGYKVSVMKKLMDGNCTQTKIDFKEEKVEEKKIIKGEKVSEKITSILSEDLSKAWTTKALSEKTSIHMNTILRHIEKLLSEKAIKIVDVETSGSSNSYVPKYQLMKSPLEKMKVTKDQKVYSTIYSYYNKKLRGKRLMFTNEIYNKVREVNPEHVCLMVGNRYYKAYAVADLKEIINEIALSKRSSTVKATNKPKSKKAEIPVEVEAAVMVSKPVQKKSVFSTIASFFSRKKDKNFLSEQTVSSN